MLTIWIAGGDRLHLHPHLLRLAAAAVPRGARHRRRVQRQPSHPGRTHRHRLTLLRGLGHLPSGTRI
jgi:hypothetical protein